MTQPSRAAGRLRQAAHRPERSQGASRPLVTLTEYVDLACPACAQAERPIRQALEVFGDETARVVRHFPLTTVHPWADFAALAAEAAAAQGKFWPMVAGIFREQAVLRAENVEEAFQALAGEIGLDPARFVQDLHSPGVRARVDEDIRRGHAAGVMDTPTLLVRSNETTDPHEETLSGPPTFASLSRAIAGRLIVRAA